MGNRLTISDLERGKSTDPIFVLNTASDSRIGLPGEIHLTIPKLNGTGNDAIKLDQTWLAQEVTAQVPRKQLLASTQFRNAMRNNLIAVIDEKEARRILESEGADDELARLEEMRNMIYKAGAARTIADSGADIHRADGVKEEAEEDTKRSVLSDDEDVSTQAKRGLSEAEPGVSQAFVMWVNKVNTGSDVTARNELKGRRTFSKAELRFMKNNLNKSFTKTLAMVSKNL